MGAGGLFRFVLGPYSIEFEQAALDSGGGGFARTLDHLFAAGYAIVEGEDRRDQLLSRLRRLPGYTPDAIEVRP